MLHLFKKDQNEVDLTWEEPIDPLEEVERDAREAIEKLNNIQATIRRLRAEREATRLGNEGYRKHGPISAG